MSDYILSCCSTADLSKEHFEQRDIHYICFHFMLDDITYPDDLGQSIPFPEFYQKMADGAMTKTSQVNADEFVDYSAHFYRREKTFCISPCLPVFPVYTTLHALPETCY